MSTEPTQQSNEQPEQESPQEPTRPAPDNSWITMDVIEKSDHRPDQEQRDS